MSEFDASLMWAQLAVTAATELVAPDPRLCSVSKCRMTLPRVQSSQPGAKSRLTPCTLQHVHKPIWLLD